MAYEAFESHEMMTELPGSGRKGVNIICIPNDHNYLSNINAVKHLKTKPGHGK